jgi:hypothetical protein
MGAPHASLETRHVMRKVVDSNYLQDDRLRIYLSASHDNYAVLTDYAAMEAFKGDTLVSISRSMEVLSQYPKQVIVLKSTGVMAMLRGRRKGLQARMVDHEQTSGFADWCKGLEKAQLGDVALQKQLLDAGRDASAHLDRMLADAKTYADNVEVAAKNYDAAQLKILRANKPYTSELIDKVIDNILNLAALLFAGHPKIVKLPPAMELPNTFIFRYALCGYLLALRWIEVGGAKNVKVERLRNDMVDASFAAYATYFDGLLSADIKATELYRDAKVLLKRAFVGPKR